MTNANPHASRFSTLWVALGIAMIPLLLMFKTRFDPIAELLWAIHPARHDVTVYFWQARLADLISLGILTAMTCWALSVSKLGSKLRPNGIVYTFIGVALALPLAWALMLVVWAARTNAWADLHGALHYDHRLMVTPMLVCCLLANGLLMLANWLEVGFVVRRRRTHRA